ncbi:glycoside hydrolase family 2 [Actinopolyspora erythraea]|uniref:Glycoside hydrolase n=1 Tax=Actinopolyspora erythraea TaxID=414996 RepID=A0A099D7U3_9ACTN|nr:sugar-binding domain-containing protein [Actinopolyspora erythraea]ASU78407.1 glycoside hydrolase family 2 [Actinopolyspora erythraea]KGI81892.1 glycoside hydrolase [Actinopolyspora erythraea]
MQSRPSRRPAVRHLGVLSMAAALALGTAPAAAAHPLKGWEPAEPPLTTPWTEQVGPDNALPEYPRPQLRRDRWKNLNGEWEYAGGTTPPERQGQLGERILVPYPVESGLSGIQRHDDHMLYRRSFELPSEWRDDELLLHFGAVDQEATVWVNGERVGSHRGGYTSFTIDVTDALRPGSRQQVTVAAEDTNERGEHPIGKQTDTPGGIFYTGSSGIWRTVWIEPVSRTHLTELNITPRLDSETFHLAPEISGPDTADVETVVSRPNGEVVSTTTTEAGAAIEAPVPDPRTWSPDDPYLYDLTVRLLDAEGGELDRVDSYAGMRSTGLVEDSRGRQRIALNGKILFQQGMLDQGFWPDGLHTPPTDEAMRHDIERAKRMGFNMLRKHIKVAPKRWYYWADRLGILVWQDMPSLTARTGGTNGAPSEGARSRFEAETTAIVDQLDSVTSLVTWVPFNEGWGEFDTARITERIERLDPSRLVDASSGVNCCNSLPDTGVGDIYDDHTYVGPGTPRATAERAAVNGEYGGLGLVERGHLWPGEPSAYEMTDSRARLTERYGQLSESLIGTIERNGLSAAVYTQVSDVENEVNGLMTYDRKITKPDVASVRADNEAIIDAGTP